MLSGFYLFFSLSLSSLPTSDLLISTLLLHLIDERITGFFVQVCDRQAYVKYTRISLYSSHQVERHTVLFYDTTKGPCTIDDK